MDRRHIGEGRPSTKAPRDRHRSRSRSPLALRNPSRDIDDRRAFLESFVVNELMRQATTVDEAITFSHFRDRSGVEVDIVIERPDGRVLAERAPTAGLSRRQWS